VDSGERSLRRSGATRRPTARVIARRGTLPKLSLTATGLSCGARRRLGRGNVGRSQGRAKVRRPLARSQTAGLASAHATLLRPSLHPAARVQSIRRTRGPSTPPSSCRPSRHRTQASNVPQTRGAVAGSSFGRAHVAARRGTHRVEETRAAQSGAKEMEAGREGQRSGTSEAKGRAPRSSGRVRPLRTMLIPLYACRYVGLGTAVGSSVRRRGTRTGSTPRAVRGSFGERGRHLQSHRKSARAGWTKKDSHTHSV